MPLGIIFVCINYNSSILAAPKFAEQHNGAMSTHLFRQTKLFFKPKRVVIDFEIATPKAVGNIWPNVIVIGCKIHLAQSRFTKM
jgi:hypothetical protein